MIDANYTELRNDFKKFLDEVEENRETLIIKRGAGKDKFMISLDEYNSMLETIYLLCSGKNASRYLNPLGKCI